MYLPFIYLSQVASHPGYSTSSSKRFTWSVSGIRCTPNHVIVQKFIGDDNKVEFLNFTKLINVGGSDIPAVTTKVCNFVIPEDANGAESVNIRTKKIIG